MGTHVVLELMMRFPDNEDEVPVNKQNNSRSTGFLDASHFAWDYCTFNIHGLKMCYDQHFYRDLIAAHLKNAVNWWHRAWNRMRAGTARDNHGLEDYIAKGMHLYWDYIELVVNGMHGRG